MKRIFKYVLELADEQVVRMPHLSEILTIQKQGEHFALWARVEQESAYEFNWKIVIRGTGHVVDGQWPHLATVQDGEFVWHFFDGGRSLVK